MSELRRLPFLACMMIVLLRMSIGWQFLYEGLWKITSLSSARPWTSAGYLKNAQGPFRDHFREMTGDPDDLGWMDYDTVARRWDDWQQRFVNHYQLDENEQRRLNDLVNGPEDFRAVLKTLPDGVKIDGSLGKAIKFDAERERLIVPGDWHLLPAERDRLLAQVTVEDDPAPGDVARNEEAKAFQKAVREVFQRSSRLSLKDRLAASLKGDTELTGFVDEKFAGTLDHKKLGQIELYRAELERYRNKLAAADLDFRFDHASKLSLPGFGDLQEMRSKIVGPIQALEEEMHREAREMLNEQQLARGPLPKPMTEIRKIDLATMWALTILGGLLIVGLFSRLSALGGAVLLTMFYLAVPPWPGVPEAPGPEHSLIVNKNLIEVIALLGIATMPTGRWLGLDALVRRVIFRRKTD